MTRPDYDELDRLHAEASKSFLDPEATSGEYVRKVGVLRCKLEVEWPAIREHVRELERKERAFDAIASRSVGISSESDTHDLVRWKAWSFSPLPPSKVADGYDLLTAIEAATKEAGHA